MRRIYCLLTLILCSVLLFPPDARAQQFTDAPICSDLVNDSDFTVYGAVETPTVAKQGSDETIHYKSSFRLGKGESTRICSSGPFFEGQRLRLTLRSLFPLFECKTRLGRPIAITATPKKGGVGYDWSASCF